MLWSFSEYRKIFDSLERMSVNKTEFYAFRNVWLNRISNSKGCNSLSLILYIIYLYPFNNFHLHWLLIDFITAPLVIFLIVGPSLWFLIIYFLCLKNIESLELKMPIVNNNKSIHAFDIAEKLSLVSAMVFTVFNITILFEGRLGTNEVIYINSSLNNTPLYFWIKEAIVIFIIIGTFIFPAYLIKRINSKNKTKYLEEICSKIMDKQESLKTNEFKPDDINLILNLRKLYLLTFFKLRLSIHTLFHHREYSFPEGSLCQSRSSRYPCS